MWCIGFVVRDHVVFVVHLSVQWKYVKIDEFIGVVRLLYSEESSAFCGDDIMGFDRTLV